MGVMESWRRGGTEGAGGGGVRGSEGVAGEVKRCRASVKGRSTPGLHCERLRS